MCCRLQIQVLRYFPLIATVEYLYSLLLLFDRYCKSLYPNYKLVSQYFLEMPPQMKLLAEAEAEQMKHWPKAEYGLCRIGFFTLCRPVWAILSPLHKLNSQKVLFTVLSCFSNKTINYKTTILKYLLNTEHFLTFYQTLYQQSTIFGVFETPFLNQTCICFCTNKCSLAKTLEFITDPNLNTMCECYNKCINGAVEG